MPTPTCPKCGKVFTKDSSITRHLIPPRRSLNPPQNLDISVDMGQGFGVGGDSQFNAQAEDSMDTNLDARDLTGNLPPASEEWYEGAARCYSQDGITFLDLFDADEHAEYRKENLFYPFTSREEWEVADFLLRSALSMAAINTFLQLSMGPSWKCQLIPSLHGTKSPIRLFWRDPVECLESLFSNPLFHDQLDFIPRRVYKTAAQLLRVYSEWLMGDTAWSIQDQLPQGATILGTVLSSDKTNVTMMTGARVAHPLLLGLANIRMRTHTKLSSKAFMLAALLPILQYLHPNQRMRGMLEDRLIHECLSIILQPLMKAAELGIMMSDPVGNIHHCFTPLAAYIVDTPEACMLACVHGKTSPFTLVSYLQFRDNFRHPTRTRAITLEQLASINTDPNDLEAFFAACADFWLNGVFTPLWKGWRFGDPAIFLTPEALHHWHKQFYDHNVQWCLVVLGAVEFDFRISILQPVTGYRHFSNGISKLKQVMGRVHRDIQCYIVGLIAGAAPRQFVVAIHHSQYFTTTKMPLSIPIEKLHRFAIATTLNSLPTDPDLEELREVEGEDDDDEDEDEEEKGASSEPMDPRTALLEELNHTRTSSNYFSKIRMLATARRDEIPQAHPPRTFLAGGTTIHLNCNPTRTSVKIDEVADQFNIPDLRYALSDFLQRDARNGNGVFGMGVPRRSLIDRPLSIPFERIQLWHTVRMQQVCLHDPSVVLPAQTIHASPAHVGWPKGCCHSQC
ncbi:hypothetical protein DEU56DRAFT_912773 [Suillus clintonianus]|uniref:uncharacterized protein n=1 Tax=Suillus clintonianus TaxID=1904413 RepID=UPI001B86C41A|nr:uncharacterized protein DEU56DRAFT_912773 [Suillus clintonianus]KAG2137000.1 hypothetical protein DEU56DRAFT_912773 [Suillus clintonianus]